MRRRKSIASAVDSGIIGGDVANGRSGRCRVLRVRCDWSGFDMGYDSTLELLSLDG